MVNLVSHPLVTPVSSFSTQVFPHNRPATGQTRAPPFLFFFFKLTQNFQRIPVEWYRDHRAPPNEVCRRHDGAPGGWGQLRNAPSRVPPLQGEHRPSRLSLPKPCDSPSACPFPGDDPRHKTPCGLSGAHPPEKGRVPRPENSKGPPRQGEARRPPPLVSPEGKQTPCGKPHGLFQEASVRPQDRICRPPTLRKHFPVGWWFQPDPNLASPERAVLNTDTQASARGRRLLRGSQAGLLYAQDGQRLHTARVPTPVGPAPALAHPDPPGRPPP